MEQNFTYYAFISYSHKDEAWAKWIQEAIERYRLPAIIRKEVKTPLPKKIQPVFLDLTDLGVGKLVDNRPWPPAMLPRDYDFNIEIHLQNKGYRIGDPC